MKRSSLLILIALLSLYGKPKIQDPTKETITSSEFRPETSTVFGLLDMSPAVINTFGTAREIKVDWFIKDNKPTDNAAIEFQPIWLIAFRNVNYKRYMELPYIVRKLGDTTLSLGNKGGSTNKLGIALNINLFRQADPTCDTNLHSQIMNTVDKDTRTIFRKISRYELFKRYATNDQQLAELDAKIEQLEEQLHKYNEKRKEENAELIKDYRAKNWNKSFVNLGAGYVLHYLLTSYQATGDVWAFWLHNGVPLGKPGMMSTLLRYHTSNILTTGINFRFGVVDRSMFLECTSDINFDNRDKTLYNINVGGNTKIVKKYFISLGFKFRFGSSMKLREIAPSYNFNLGF